MVWSKIARPRDRLYPAGFASSTSIIGSQYIPPAPGSRIVDFAAGHFAASDGFFLPFTIGTDNKVVSDDETFPLKFIPATGLFSGRFTDPETLHPVHFRGAVSQNLQIGNGFFLRANQSGWILFKATE